MRYLSLFSGIEAASVAWGPLGLEPLAFSEIEKFPSALLAEHYPSVPNLGDVTKHKEWPALEPDIIVGGSPCQAFSVAGLRRGLEDPRGNLTLTFLAVVDQYRPEWVVWENVPGVLSIDGGRTFGAFLGALAKLGYGFAYRVLDAQFFGVAQRRRRVFVVANARDWRRAAAVLFEPESLRGDSPPSREEGEGVTPGVAGNSWKVSREKSHRTRRARRLRPLRYDADHEQGELLAPETRRPLSSAGGRAARSGHRLRRPPEQRDPVRHKDGAAGHGRAHDGGDFPRGANGCA